MKKKWLAVVLLGMLCICACAHALETPSNALFSPGLKKLAQMENARQNVTAQAQVSIDKAMYARDLSLLKAMLDGAAITYQRSDEGEMVAIQRGGERLGTYELPAHAALDALEERLLGTAILERVPLTGIADWLEGLKAGDVLVPGYRVGEPFDVVRTMSDNGLRLTKIQVDGSAVHEDGAIWRISGYLRQPGGRAPKDTFELMLERDEDNYIELLYSALRENEVTRKNKEGTVSVRTNLKAAGKIAGSGISSRLSVTAKNRWTSDGEKLSERVTLSAEIGHTDRTPGRRMQRLNDVSAQMKNTIRLTTGETQETMELSDEIVFSVTLDSNSFLSGSADVSMRVGDEMKPEPSQMQEMDSMSAKALAKRIYHTLDEKEKNTLEEGLDQARNPE